MKIAFFNTKSYDRKSFLEVNKKFQHEITFFEAHINVATSKLAAGFEVVCVFVNDELDENVLKALSKEGVKLIALRCAGFNNVDLKAAGDFGITVVRVPAYSPHGVAEHAAALMLALNRKINRAYNRVREGNFSIDGFLGFEIYGKNVGIVGTGKIGCNLARIMKGFGANVIAYDSKENTQCVEMGVKYSSLNDLFEQSEIISLHLPLNKETYHLINNDSLSKMKAGVMIINTSRGGLIETEAVIAGLKSGKVGYLGLDVYEEEEELFFEDLSGNILQDDVFARLLTFPNVIITGHQAFFTDTALKNIAETTLQNITDYANGRIKSENQVHMEVK